MLTFLSRSIRRFLVTTPSGEAATVSVRALPASTEQRATTRLPQLPAANAYLRLVKPGDDRDISIAPAANHVGAAAFVAGQGARIYSLDVFRNARRGGPHPPRRAA